MAAEQVIDRAGLDRLVEVLQAEDYRVIGPQLRDDAIVLDELRSGAELPDGWGVTVAPGRYRVVQRADSAVFAHSAGPGSWKRFLHPPQRTTARIAPDLTAEPVVEPTARMAFLGVRGCDLAAIATLRSVLGAGRHPDPDFVRRDDGLFVVAVDCTEPGELCFCASTGTGPGAGPGYDLALTEQLDEAGHRFLVTTGSDAGAAILEQLPARPATAAEITGARDAIEAAGRCQHRALPDRDLPELLRDSRESPHWEEVANRCLACGNCTMVCPTCFCTATEDVTDLTGADAERRQRWASCFEIDFSYVHGGSVRQSGASRYRQWLTHKLGTWQEMHDSAGCVGCGRCIAWCPAEIDLTAEVARLAELTPLPDNTPGDRDDDR
ncbi:4Fe-4S dicluster domain-containing protein [Nocardia stercoris]|uniref:4Fe-4S ferredoxin n=1 Tax=Nocardia stercoris TaxID=2483361 RepID=A0A3M2L753_9NOCA|nr:4Fe-4S dicluster domain-containing protein [Nocardia stercoris]RMI33542.1 4Fe-4S ferredoxin [Nocardia stercoris]